MNPLDEQPDGQKVETGAQDVQDPEKQDEGNKLKEQQDRENAKASQEHREGKASIANKAEESRAALLVDSTSSTSTPPAIGDSPKAEAAKGGWTDKLKGFGDKLKGLFTGIFSSFKGVFSKIKDSLSGIFGKKKTTEESNTTPSASSETTAASSEAVSGSWEQVIQSEAQRLGIEPAFLYAVLKVESGNIGPFSKTTGKPVIRFEPHIFIGNKNVSRDKAGWGKSRLTGRHVDGVSCEGGQANEQACLNRAIEINEEAAYRSISMGQPQIMGFNAGITGYPSAKAMYEAFANKSTGAVAQIKGMITLIEKNKTVLAACRRKDFGTFTRNYNGSKPGSALYAKYTSRMKAEYHKRKSMMRGSSDERMVA